MSLRDRVRIWQLPFLSAVLAALPALATERFVNNSCAMNGNGLAATCASSSGGTGAYNSGAGIQAAITASSCGDIVTVAQGSGAAYFDSIQGSGDNYQNGAFLIRGKSCSAASPFTLRGADRANKPLLCIQSNCAYVDTPTLSIQSSQYVIVDGVKVDGMLAAYNPGTANHLEIRYSEFIGGSMCDGNFSLFYFSDVYDSWVHHNYLHDLDAGSCGNGHFDGFKTFRTRRNIYEYNTIAVGSGHSMNHPIDLKDCTYFDTWRYNIVPGELAMNRQTGSCGVQPGNGEIYGNVVTHGTIVAYGNIPNMHLYNNTVAGIAMTSDGGDCSPIDVHDNLIYEGGGKNQANVNVEVDSGNWGLRSTDNWAWDYNVYLGSANYYGGGTSYSDLASWRTALGGGRDSHSSERTCSFISTSLGSADFYKLASGSPCKTAGTPVGGTGSEVGAYGVTSCVGHLCSSTPAVCGNNVRESGETCDGTDLGGATCVTQGFGGGTLACGTGCASFNTSGCTGDATPPVRSNGAPSGALAAGTTQTTVTLTTNENATCKYATTAGVSYASMTNTFSTTGGTTHQTTVTGLADGQAYTYNVRCRDAASNANPDDYPIAFSVSSSATAALECANWQTNHPTWIWCDDLESDTQLVNDYFDVDRQSGTLGVATDQHYGGTHSLKFHYPQGGESIGWIWRSFGRNPLQQKSDPTTDFQEVYWRFYVRHQSPWTADLSAGGDKYSRATMFVGGDWSQGMIAHIWNNSSRGLQQSPVRCASGTGTVCTGYNDFAHMIYEGDVNGTHTITASADVGQWHCVEGHVKLNTPGSSDGVFQTWIDGTQDMNDTSINWRDRYTGYGINAISLEGVWNGGSPTTQDRWMDNFIISRDRIGCSASSPDTNPTTPTGLHRTDTK